MSVKVFAKAFSASNPDAVKTWSKLLLIDLIALAERLEK